MALTLVTTPGSATANAYASVADVTAVADTLYPAPDDWYTASDDDQARAIAWITKRIDQEHLRGERVDSTQVLEFPRQGLLNEAELDGEATTAIPARVVRATALGAIELVRLQAANGTDPATTQTNPALSSISLGSEFSATFESGATSLSPFERVFAAVVRPALFGLIKNPGVVRTVRG